ncbi:MAG: kinase [Sphingomonas sp.]|nr:kinase [Sphingomonas sp.]
MLQADTAETILAALDERLAQAGALPFVLGIAGAQGSGKSTVAAQLAERLRARGLRAALLSLDDLYLDGAQRAVLAASVHPLLRTRGVPGTHDVALGLEVIGALGREGHTLLPRFDKGRDEPGEWEGFDGPADVLIFEGWCVGARPQDDAELAAPVNALERDRDADGRWRGFVNAQLAGPYAALFARIDMLVLLAAPGFEVVADWRIEQEQALRRQGAGAMDDEQVRAFVLHYQRLTEHMLRHGADWPNLTIRLDAARRPVEILA